MEREPQRLGELLRDFLRKYGFEELQVMAQLPQLWTEVVGPLAARVSRIVSFADGELVVEVVVPTWQLELRLRAEELRRRLNERIGSEAVRCLVIR